MPTVRFSYELLIVVLVHKYPTLYVYRVCEDNLFWVEYAMINEQLLQREQFVILHFGNDRILKLI